MPVFDKSHIGALKEHLYNSHIHDAQITSLSYDIENRRLEIEAVNSFYNDGMLFTLTDIKTTLFTRGDWNGNCRTIISLSVEEYHSLIPGIGKEPSGFSDDDLHVLFQMLSGDELLVVSREIGIEMIK